MPTYFPTPERCLLAQAALWFIDRNSVPVPDDAYRRAPSKFPTLFPKPRDLFLALLAKDCDLRGDLHVEFKQYKKTNIMRK